MLIWEEEERRSGHGPWSIGQGGGRGEKDSVLVIYMNPGDRIYGCRFNSPCFFSFYIFAWPAERSGTTNTDIMAVGKRKGLECALIELAKCGCDFTRSLSALVEDKGMRTTRYVALLLGMMSRWRDIRRNVGRLRFRPLLA